MKICSIICILFISFSCQNQIGLAGRDFLTGLLTSIKGPEFHLNDNCLNADFDKDSAILIEALNRKEYNVAMEFIGKILHDIVDNCPTSDLAQILKDTMAGGPIELYKKIHKHGVEVLAIIKEEFLVSNITYKNIGEATGRVIELVIYTKSFNTTQLEFLSITK